MAPAVTVIVPARNATGCLPLLLDALAAQSAPRDLFEVIVADDASSDGTPRLVEESGIARLVRVARQGGSYAARNVAIEQARGEVLAFTDADCVPHATWIERGLDAIRAREADIVAGHIDVPLGSRPTAAALLGLAKHHLDQEYHAAEQGYGATANLWVDRRVLALAGAFDPEVTSGGDGEFCRRATAAGARLRYDRDVVVSHPPRSRARDLLRKQVRIGYGAAQLRIRDENEELPRIWSRPGAYVPRIAVRGLDTLERRGYQLTRGQRTRIALVQYFCSQLPIAVGNLAGSVSETVSRRNGAGAAEG